MPQILATVFDALAGAGPASWLEGGPNLCRQAKKEKRRHAANTALFRLSFSSEGISFISKKYIGTFRTEKTLRTAFTDTHSSQLINNKRLVCFGERGEKEGLSSLVYLWA